MSSTEEVDIRPLIYRIMRLLHFLGHIEESSSVPSA